MKDARFSSKAYGTHDFKEITVEGRVQFDLLQVGNIHGGERRAGPKGWQSWQLLVARAKAASCACEAGTQPRICPCCTP